MTDSVQPAVVGPTGYAGFELARLLLRHPRVKKPLLFAREGEAAIKAAPINPMRTNPAIISP